MSLCFVELNNSDARTK